MKKWAQSVTNLSETVLPVEKKKKKNLLLHLTSMFSLFSENFPLSDLLAETSTGLEASMSNSTSCRY